jgi:RNA polymerase sigma factor (sigma-70 family)
MAHDNTLPWVSAFARHHDDLLRFFIRKLGCRDLAADCAQETHVHLARMGSSVPVQNPRAFLFRVATNLAIDYLRKSRTRGTIFSIEPPPEDAPSAAPSVEDVIEAKQRVVRLEAAIKELSAKCRTALLLNGVTGRHTPHEAIGLLLSGTGLTYRLTEANTMTLERVPVPVQTPSGPNQGSSLAAENTGPRAQDGQKPVKISQVVVKEFREHDYAVDDASTATHIPAPIHDTPRSVEVVTRQVIDDQKVIRFADALRNVSGTFQSSTQGGQGGTFMIRGFASDLNVFKNGFRDDSTFSSRVQRDIINIERIEVVKGPPSYLFGRSDPGGVINQITLYYRKQEAFKRTTLLAAVNFTNLLDQRYFTGSQFVREIVYTGAPLTVIGSLKLEFF